MTKGRAWKCLTRELKQFKTFSEKFLQLLSLVGGQRFRVQVESDVVHQTLRQTRIIHPVVWSESGNISGKIIIIKNNLELLCNHVLFIIKWFEWLTYKSKKAPEIVWIVEILI